MNNPPYPCSLLKKYLIMIMQILLLKALPFGKGGVPNLPGERGTRLKIA